MEAFWGILIIRGGGRVADKEKKTTPRFELNPDSRNPRHQSRVLSSPRVIPLYPVSPGEVASLIPLYYNPLVIIKQKRLVNF